MEIFTRRYLTYDKQPRKILAMAVIRRARLIREARGLSISEVARAAGIDVAQLSRFERNERMMRYEALAKLSRFFRVPIDELLKEATIDDESEPEREAAVGS